MGDSEICSGTAVSAEREDLQADSDSGLSESGVLQDSPEKAEAAITPKTDEGYLLALALLIFGLLVAINAVSLPEQSRVPSVPTAVQTQPVTERMLLGEINLNTADFDRLCSLPGIGEKRANAIIEYRRENGIFTDVRELLEVEGIGEKILEGLLPYICVS